MWRLLCDYRQQMILRLLLPFLQNTEKKFGNFEVQTVYKILTCLLCDIFLRKVSTSHSFITLSVDAVTAYLFGEPQFLLKLTTVILENKTGITKTKTCQL